MARKVKNTRKQKIRTEHIYMPQSRENDQISMVMPRNPSQVDALHYLNTKTLTILTGPPGTAKTLLSAYAACKALERREIEKIYYVKPIVDVVGEQGLGFLPGEISEKTAPHIAPLRDALSVFMPKGKADYLIEKEIIEFLPLDQLRGRSLARCFIIADEMQNAIPKSVLTVLTRLSSDSKVALLGDVVQRDLGFTFGKDGLSDAIGRLSKIADVGHVEFSFNEIVRSGFVKSVIREYADLYKA
jgi:phosphate starvation-inducible PhoH-like protein